MPTDPRDPRWLAAAQGAHEALARDYATATQGYRLNLAYRLDNLERYMIDNDIPFTPADFDEPVPEAPRGVNPADYEAAMRPEAGDPWVAMPHYPGWWINDREHGWLGPFDDATAAFDKSDTLTYIGDWQVVAVSRVNWPAGAESPF